MQRGEMARECDDLPAKLAPIQRKRCEVGGGRKLFGACRSHVRGSNRMPSRRAARAVRDAGDGRLWRSFDPAALHSLCQERDARMIGLLDLS